MTHLDHNHRAPDFRKKSEVLKQYNNNSQMRARAEGVINYLLDNYDTDNGYYGYINKKNRIEYHFNRLSEDRFYCLINPNWVTVRFNVNKVDVKGKFTILKRQGRRGRNSKEVGVNYYVDFIISENDDLEQLDAFLALNKISNVQHSANLWSKVKLEASPAEVSTSAYTPSGKEITIHGYEALLAINFNHWLKTNYNIKKINFEQPAATISINDRLDATFAIEGIGEIIAELKSIREGTTSSKACIRNALGQLIDYRHYGDGNEAEQLWIVLDSAPSEMDIEFVKKIEFIYQLPIKLVNQVSSGIFHIN